MSTTLYREATMNEAMRWKESGARIMSGIPVEVDDEAARNAYINARVAVAAKLITGTPMEPHDEAAFVLSMVRDAALGIGDN
jgi:hypothetical protein